MNNVQIVLTHREALRSLKSEVCGVDKDYEHGEILETEIVSKVSVFP